MEGQLRQIPYEEAARQGADWVYCFDADEFAYFENIDFKGKDIVLISSHGAGVTIIDGMQLGRVVQFAGGESMDAALELAEKMSKLSPYGLKMTKRTLWAALEIPGLQAAIDLENRNQLLLGLTNNLPEFIIARREKREPVYEDIPRIID